MSTDKLNKELSFDVNQDVRKDITVLTSGHDEMEERIIRIALTHEGVIMDFYKDSELSSTVGMTYDEWFEFSER